MTSQKASSSASKADSRYLIVAIGGFMVLLGVLLWGAGAGHAQSPPPMHEPETVMTDVVNIQQGFVVPTSMRGLVESSQQAELSFDIAGKLASLEVDEGDVVVQGAPLATLDTARLRAQVTELEAALTRAKANAELARLVKSRVDELVGQQLESGQRRDETRAQLTAANAQVAEVEAALNRVQVELDKSQLRAPFDGHIAARYVDEGTTVSPSSAVFRLTNTTKLQARFAVPARDITRFSEGQTVNVSVGERTYAATVTQRVAQRSTQTRTIDMLVTFVTAPDILPGDMAVLTVERQREERGAWVPVTALSNGLRGLWTIFVLDQQVANERAHHVNARSVEVIYTDGRKAFIRGALRDGEQFVVGGTHKLSPGQLVVTTSQAPETAGTQQ